MISKFPVALTAAAILFLSAPASAQEFNVPIDLPKGAVIDITIQTTKTEVRAGKAPPAATGTFQYRQTLTPKGDGYRVHQVMTGSKFPEGAQPSAQESQMLTAASELTYLADSDLAPAEMIDWPATVDRLMAVIAKASDEESKPALEQTRKMFQGMSPQMAAQVMLKEQTLLAMPQMMALDRSEALEQEQQVPNPLGGPPIDSLFRVELVSIDKAASRAVIRSTQTLDPKSMAQSMQAAMTQMAQAMGAGPAPKDFAMDRTMTCTYDMDLKTGLTAKVDCDMKATFTAAGKTGGRNERTVITQTLVSQP